MMPTSYTAAIHDGTETDFNSFAVRCCKAFVAHNDGDSHDMVDYHARSLADAESRYLELIKMTPEEALLKADEQHRLDYGEHLQSKQKHLERRVRYRAMLDQIYAWTPPSEEHWPLKKFMIQQIEEDMNRDCGPLPEPKKVSGREWLRMQRKMAREDIEYTEKQLTEAQDKKVKASKYLQLFYGSLP